MKLLDFAPLEVAALPQRTTSAQEAQVRQ